MILCERYARFKLEYRLLTGSKKYREYTRRAVKYNTHDDSLVQFAKIDREQARLDTDIATTKVAKESSRLAIETSRAKLRRLKLQKEALRKREIDLVVRGVSIIEELERIEEEERLIAPKE